MTQRFLSTVLLFLYMSMTGAQTTSSQWMQHIAAYNDSIFGVKTIVPDSFWVSSDSLTMIDYSPNKTWENNKGGNQGSYLYCATAISNDRHAMLLYPYIIFTRGKIDSCADYAFTLCRRQVDCELAAATQDNVNGYDKHIISIGGTRAKHWGNADSVYIVDFPSCIPCLKQYTHCIGIYLAKTGRTPIFMKVLLSDEGYANRKDIMDRVSCSMTFLEKPMAEKPAAIAATNRLFGLHNGRVQPLRHGERQP